MIHAPRCSFSFTPQVHRLYADGILTVKPEAQAGVPDILDLNDFSEMSLLTTVRARYLRDEVYTFVGPILISINPYKWNHNLYSEANMIHYHTSEADHLAPHLFKVRKVYRDIIAVACYVDFLTLFLSPYQFNRWQMHLILSLLMMDQRCQPINPSLSVERVEQERRKP